MNVRSRGLGVLSEAFIVLLSFLGAVLVRFEGLEAFLTYRALVPKALLCVVVVILPEMENALKPSWIETLLNP